MPSTGGFLWRSPPAQPLGSLQACFLLLLCMTFSFLMLDGSPCFSSPAILKDISPTWFFHIRAWWSIIHETRNISSQTSKKCVCEGAYSCFYEGKRYNQPGDSKPAASLKQEEKQRSYLAIVKQAAYSCTININAVWLLWRHTMCQAYHLIHLHTS